jgi:hypothetical protein
MRIKGLLRISNDEACPTGTVFLDIPFKNLPLYPLGTELYITTTDGVVYLEDVKICDYVGDTKYGTIVNCSDGGIAKLFIAATEAEACTFDGIDGYRYNGLVNFSNC